MAPYITTGCRVWFFFSVSLHWDRINNFADDVLLWFQAAGYFTPWHPTLFFFFFFPHRRIVTVLHDVKTHTSDLQGVSILKFALCWSGSRKNVSVEHSYVLLSLRSCRYIANPKVVMCSLRWVCYQYWYVENKFKKKWKKIITTSKTPLGNH